MEDFWRMGIQFVVMLTPGGRLTPESGLFCRSSVAGFRSLRVSPKCINMGVSKNRGTPKWMVYNGKPC